LAAPELPILPSTRVGELLDRYPQLEDVLIALAPPFRKLKNPLLRKGVARLASLQHAAVVGGMSVSALVSELRRVVGQDALSVEEPDDMSSYFSEQPEWFKTDRIVQSIDERLGDPDQMPVARVLQLAAHLRACEIIELITTFIPAPGIEVLKKKGFLVWSVREEGGLIRTYVSRPAADA
jgi:hypothetical protein